MEFTKAEAKEKEKNRQWVRTRDDYFEEEGVPKGTRGQVVGADPLGTVEVATSTEIWVVHVRFYSENIMIPNIGKERYEESLLEFEVDRP